MDVSEVSKDELAIDVDVISVYTYDGSVVVAFVDSSGEHGAVMEPDEAHALAESLMNAVSVAIVWSKEDINVN